MFSITQYKSIKFSKNYLIEVWWPTHTLQAMICSLQITRLHILASGVCVKHTPEANIWSLDCISLLAVYVSATELQLGSYF